MPGRRRRGLWALAIAGVLVLVAGTAGALAYSHLNANITAAPLFAGTTGDAGTETRDAFGAAPINLLVIGSDGRGTAADCRIGGDCGTGVNADVEMVVHVSADRSNATVMSIPRDTVTELPACRDSQTGRSMAQHTGQINSTLYYGPGCTVAAVHRLTGIPIDHFVMVDFAGVVTMSDAVGGVQVCVSDNVYDPYSHLKLGKGTHTLQGLAALEFLRSRHAFGDGSDLGRTYAQHLFLSAMIRNLKSAGTLANPAAVYRLADAATRALTVDTGLGSIPALVGLAADLDQVPAHRITFVTMPNAPDPANSARVVVTPAARPLFAAIAADRPLTAPATTPSATAPGRPLTAPATTPSATAPGAPAPTRTAAASASPQPGPALTEAHAQTADQSGSCAPVSRDRTVVVAGRAMSPIQAFAATPDVPVSAA